MVNKMADKFYFHKQVLGNWYNPYNKEKMEVSAVTYEGSQQPSREEELKRELLKKLLLNYRSFF